MNKLNTLAEETSKKFLLDVPSVCKPSYRVSLQIPYRLFYPQLSTFTPVIQNVITHLNHCKEDAT